MGGWAWDDEPPSADALRLLQNARRLYDRIGELTQQARISPDPFAITPELILEFHAIATDGEPDPEKVPGKLRERDVVVAVAGVTLYEPPPWQLVAGFVDDLCPQLEVLRATAPTLHAAAYALWRLNWIHPFPDGNGKTARAIMYLVLCIGFRRMLPGEPAVPDLIAQQPRRYWRSLQAADVALKRGAVDLADVEALISEVIEYVLPGED